MSIDNQNQDKFIADNTINFNDVLKALLLSKKLIFICILLSSSLISLYSLTIPNIYTSVTILAPAQQSDSGAQGSMRSFGGLASLAGINLPSGSANNTIVALKTLTSLKFFEISFLPYINLEDLMAVEKWDLESNQIIYDQSIFLNDSDKWIRKVKFPYKSIPSVQESHKKFLKDHLNFEEDIESGFVTLSINHQSPYVAFDWLNILIENINSTLRAEHQEKTNQSVKFLNQQIVKTSFTEVKEAISSILEKETEKLMLIEANQDYIFRKIDPPYIPEEKSGPDRLMMLIFGAVFGLIVGIFIGFYRYFKE